MDHSGALGVGRFELRLPDGIQPAGLRALAGINRWAESILAAFRSALAGTGSERGAAIGRVRGTGPGASFGAIVADIERDYPVELAAPFEGCDAVAGAVWDCPRLLPAPCKTALLKLRFARGAVDLPLHTHDHSDRFIVVLGGRGFFHVRAIEAREGFTEPASSIPVRSRDVVVFTRGVTHTFSAPAEDLVLLSFHAPFVALDDERQFTVAGNAVTPREILARARGSAPACDPTWFRVA